MTRAWGGRERCWDTNVQLGRKAEEGWQPVGRKQSGGSAFSQGERHVCRKSGGVRVHQKVRFEGPPLSSGKSTFVTQEQSTLMATQPRARGEGALISDTLQTILL